MADKPNMYRGLAKEQGIMKKMKESAGIHYNSEGIPDGIPMYGVGLLKKFMMMHLH